MQCFLGSNRETHSGRLGAVLGACLKPNLLCIGVVCLFSFLAFSKVAGARDIELTLDTSGTDYALHQYLGYWPDPDKDTTIDTLLQRMAGARWQYGFHQVPNFGYTEIGHWFRLDVENQSDRLLWYLMIDYSTIRVLDLYRVEQGELVNIVQTGDRFEFSARPLLHRSFVFPLHIERGAQVTFFIYMEGPYSLQLPASIRDPSTLLLWEVGSSLLHGLFFGILLAVVLHAVLLFRLHRDPVYLVYIVFILSLGVFQAAQLGYGFQYLWPVNIELQHAVIGLSLCVALMSGAAFVSTFLKLGLHAIWLDRACWLCFTCAAIVFCLSWQMEDVAVLRVVTYLCLIFCIIGALTGFLSWRREKEAARLFTWGWLVLGVAGFSLASSRLGLLPRTNVTEYAIELGITLFALLLALALARRTEMMLLVKQRSVDQEREVERLLLDEKEHALALQKHSNEHLEQSVQARTEELHKAISELTMVNHRMEELNTHDQLTGVGNSIAYEERIQHEWERGLRDKLPLSLIVVALDDFGQVSDRYGSVAAEETLKVVAQRIKSAVTRPADLVARIGSSEFGMVLPNTDAAGAEFVARDLVGQISSEPINLGVCAVAVTVSVVVATRIPSEESNFMSFMESAENRLLQILALGENRVVSVEPTVNP